MSGTGVDPMLEMDTWLDGGRLVVELVGELDVYTARSLRGALDQTPRDDRRRIAVEMSRLDFLDSSGLGVLVGATKHAQSLGGGLCMVRPKDRILKTLRITGLIRVIPPFDDLPKAFAWLDAL